MLRPYRYIRKYEMHPTISLFPTKLELKIFLITHYLPLFVPLFPLAKRYIYDSIVHVFCGSDRADKGAIDISELLLKVAELN